MTGVVLGHIYNYGLVNIVGYLPLTFILITYTFQISEEYRVCASTIYTSTQFAQRLSSNQLSTIFDKNLKKYLA